MRVAGGGVGGVGPPTPRFGGPQRCAGIVERVTKRANLLALLLGVGLLTVAIDQATKQWALNALSDGHTVPIIGDWLGLKLIFNSGAAFGMGTSTTWIFTLISAAVVVGVPFFFKSIKQPSMAVIIGLIWGGALGNLLDRLLRDPGFPGGHVVDFIKYGDLFIGNVADIALVVGLIIVLFIEFFRKDTAKEPKETAAEVLAEDSADEAVTDAETGADSVVDDESSPSDDADLEAGDSPAEAKA